MQSVSACASTPERSPVNEARAMTKMSPGSIGVNERNSSVFRGDSWRACKKVELHKAFEGEDGSETVETCPWNHVNGSTSRKNALNELADIQPG